MPITHSPRFLRGLRYLLLALAVAPLAGQQEEAFRRDLEQLTDPALEGRGIGTPGGELAIEYIVGAMREAGLSPWLQGTFRQDFWIRSPASTFSDETGISVNRGSVFRPLTSGEEALPFQHSSEGTVCGPLVFAGYGLRIPSLGHDDYAGLDVRGKVVLVLRHAPDWNNPDSPYRAHEAMWSFGTKFALARSAGAIGVLLVDPPSEERGAQDISTARLVSARSEIPAFLITRAAAVSLSGGKKGFLARERRLMQGLDGALGPVPGVELTLRVEREPGPPGPKTSNVIGWLRGSDPALEGECIVVGAHHDHIGRGYRGSLGGPEAVGAIHPGADDNASGVAGILSLARTMVNGPRLRRSVLFVAFGAGESGLRGSRYFLSALPFPPDRIVAMVNLDMIGRARDCFPRVSGASTGRGLDQLLRESGSAADLKLRLVKSSSPPSDHRTFVQQGIPSLHFHTGLHDQFHSPADISGLVDVAGAVDIVRVVDALVRGLGNADGRPVFTGRRCP